MISEGNDDRPARPEECAGQNWRQLRSDEGDLGIDGIDDVEPGSGELERRKTSRSADPHPYTGQPSTHDAPESDQDRY